MVDDEDAWPRVQTRRGEVDMADEKYVGTINVRVRGYMGVDIAGGADVDDAEVTPGPTS